MKPSHYCLSIALLLVLSCKDNSVGPEFVEPSLRSISYQQTDYDKYTVRLQAGAKFASKAVSAIVVGVIEGSQFVVRDSIALTFNDQSKTYEANVQAVVLIADTSAYSSIRVRYYGVSGTETDFDTTLSTMTFPYLGTEPVWSTSIDIGTSFAEDIDVSDSVIYGQINDRVAIHSMRSGTTSFIQPSSYEVLTVVDNRYVFYDHADYSLYRYDLNSGAKVEFVPHSSSAFMMGLESYDGALYELLFVNPHLTLFKYSMAGALLDSIAMDRNVSRLTILDGYAYFHTWSDVNPILRFNLATKTFDAQFKPPSASYEGIRIRGGFLYFSDLAKRTVARFPVGQLFEYGQMPLNPSASITTSLLRSRSESLNR